MVLAASLVAVGGCANMPYPQARIYPASTQQKMQAAHHWDLMAKDIADQITARGGNDGRPLYLTTREEGPFADAFNDLLRTKLVQNGNAVMMAPSSQALRIDYAVRVVHHKGERQGHRFGPGAALGGGLLVARAAGAAALGSLVSVGAPLALVGTDFAMDGTALPTDCEIVVTTTIDDGRQYHWSESQIYYVNDADLDHYKKATAPSRPANLLVTGEI